MKENKDYISYLIGIASIFLTLISFFKDESQRFNFLLFGAAGTGVAFIILYINSYIGKIDELGKEVKELKREYGFSEQVRILKQEIEKLKRDKRGKNTDFVDLIKIVFLLIILYVILKALGFLP